MGQKSGPQAAAPADEAGRRFEYGFARGSGSAAFIVGSLLAGRIIIADGLDAIVWGGSAFLVAAAGAAIRVSAARTSAEWSFAARRSLWLLLRLPRFRLLLIIAALVLGSHAMHDAFAMIRWQAAGIAPTTASLLWSESVAAEVLGFFALGPWLLHRIDASTAMAIAAAAGAIRWGIFAMTANVAAMALAEPLHGLTFALLHLACMRLIGQLAPSGLAATAQAIYGTVAIGAVTSLLSLASGGLYGRLGAAGFWVMAALSILALPFIVKLRCAKEAPKFVLGLLEDLSPRGGEIPSRAIDIEHQHRNRRTIRARLASFAAFGGAFERSRNRFRSPEIEHAGV
jgi:PPP family 3-phenylpropionic acid transporter